MTRRLNYWSPIEQQWRDDHLDSLRPHLELTLKTHDFVARIATHPDIVSNEESDRINVARLLLKRLGEELRAVELLAEHGHGFQAATAACNLFEQSHYLTYVGMDDANALTFIRWKDPHKLPISVRQLVNQSGKTRFWPQNRCDEEYEKYRFLCGFKHNNPLFKCLLRLPTDPDAYLTKYALAESVWCILSAVGMFALLFLRPPCVMAALEECNDLMDSTGSMFPTIESTDSAHQ